MTSIAQAAAPPALPDFRNLGIQLRILVAVNALALAAALVRGETLAAAGDAFLALSPFVQPVIIASLAVLFIAAPWLAKLPWPRGPFAVFGIELVLVTGAHALSVSLLGAEAVGPLWRFLLFGAITTGALLGYFSLRSRALSPAIAEARLQALQARIRPHFLFNSLNAVLSLVRSEPRRAERALEDLAGLFRVLMSDSRRLATLDDEVRLCRQYLDLEQLRLGDRLKVEWHVDNMPADALVPPLVLQPLIENAVYHGIEPMEGPGTVSIGIFRRRDEVHMVLKNPYPGGGVHHEGNRMAIANIRERLELHFDDEASLDMKATGDTWQVHITLPYRGGEPR